MAYKIYYGPKGKYVNPSRKGRVFFFTILFFLLFAVTAWKLIPQQLLALQQIILPDAKLNTLLEDLHEGQDLIQAIGSFCQEIFSGA